MYRKISTTPNKINSHPTANAFIPVNYFSSQPQQRIPNKIPPARNRSPPLSRKIPTRSPGPDRGPARALHFVRAAPRDNKDLAAMKQERITHTHRTDTQHVRPSGSSSAVAALENTRAITAVPAQDTCTYIRIAH